MTNLDLLFECVDAEARHGVSLMSEQNGLQKKALPPTPSHFVAATPSSAYAFEDFVDVCSFGES